MGWAAACAAPPSGLPRCATRLRHRAAKPAGSTATHTHLPQAGVLLGVAALRLGVAGPGAVLQGRGAWRMVQLMQPVPHGGCCAAGGLERARPRAAAALARATQTPAPLQPRLARKHRVIEHPRKPPPSPARLRGCCSRFTNRHSFPPPPPPPRTPHLGDAVVHGVGPGALGKGGGGGLVEGLQDGGVWGGGGGG